MRDIARFEESEVSSEEGLGRSLVAYIIRVVQVRCTVEIWIKPE